LQHIFFYRFSVVLPHHFDAAPVSAPERINAAVIALALQNSNIWKFFYGSGSDSSNEMMQLLAAPAPQHYTLFNVISIDFYSFMSRIYA
jgi:predicted NAD/FAD-dependent oxidoreductase